MFVASYCSSLCSCGDQYGTVVKEFSGFFILMAVAEEPVFSPSLSLLAISLPPSSST